MKLNKHMKTLVKALIATANEPLRKQIEDLKYEVECAESKALNLEAKLNAAEAKRDELSSELSKVEAELVAAVEAREIAEDRVKNLNENFKD